MDLFGQSQAQKSGVDLGLLSRSKPVRNIHGKKSLLCIGYKKKESDSRVILKVWIKCGRHIV